MKEHLASLEESGEMEVFDDGEEYDNEYLFFISDASEDRLLQVASGIADREGVPVGAYAVLNDDKAEEFGAGRRVDLPLG